jgi:hypothetical protein
MTKLTQCQTALLTYLKTILLALCAVASVHPALSQALTFTDDFNRPDSPTVGNGWSDTAGNISSNLEIRNNELTCPGTGGAGIFRPFPFTAPTTVTAKVKEMNGFGSLLRRYVTGVWILNDGVRDNGYGVVFLRSDQDFANSQVRLYDATTNVANEDSTFQYGPEINISITFSLDGNVTGTVSEPAPSTNTFSFSFGPRTIQSTGGNFSVATECSSGAVDPRIDDVSIMSSDQTPCGVLPSGLNTCLLQKGDILLATLPNRNLARIPAGTYWFHTATYLSNGKIAEAIGAELEDDDEVRTIDIHSIIDSEWTDSSLIDWAVIRPDVNSTIREAAADYTGDKADQGDLRINPLDTRPKILYNSFLEAFTRDKNLEDKFYCSQLPWKAYEKQGLDLETNSEDIGLVSLPNIILDNAFFTNFVSPDDLYASIVPQLLTNTPKSSLVAQKVTGLGGAITRLLFRVFSPVNILLVDGLGRRTGFDANAGEVLNEIPGTTYTGTQAEPETITATGVEGDLSLHIIGTDNGSYTLEAINYDLNDTRNQVITGDTSPGKEDNYRVSQGSEQIITLVYDFTGFFQPVDNLPTLNAVKAGSAVPVKFSLSGNQGLNIFSAGYPVSQTIACGSGAVIDNIEQTVTAGSSSLSYDASTDQYTYVWKTTTTWAGTCRQLIVRLNDSTDHPANFKFK